ncbi:MAG: hypothetical protein ACOCP8_00605 [archaeon]
MFNEECQYKSVFGCNHYKNPETILGKERGFNVTKEHGRCLEELCPKKKPNNNNITFDDYNKPI